MQNLPAIPEAFKPHFDQMWQSACRVCDNIRDFQPDLVLALMHSGWGPVFAAQTLWSLTQPGPFPPLARSNLGREKIDIFERTFNMLYTEWFVGEYSSTIDVGRLLAWLTTRNDWQEQLRQQAADALQTADAPRRILVVDDCVHEGSTFMLTLGLLGLVFPQAELRFLNANSWYRSHYRDFMLACLCPPDLFPEGKPPSNEISTQLARVAVGSENVAEDSLLWQPISIDSPSVQALSSYLPPAAWVEMPRQIYALIAQSIADRAASYAPAPPNPQDANFGLRAEWRLMRDIWLQNGVTRRQAEERYGLSAREVRGLLESWMEYDEVELVGRGRGARYRIPPALQARINRQDDSEPVKHEHYWLLPGRLMFGESPYTSPNEDGEEWSREEMRDLLALGEDCWLDVQFVTSGVFPPPNHFYLEEGQALGRLVMTRVVPLAVRRAHPDGYETQQPRRPNRADIRQVLDEIDTCLAEGRVVYVSAPTDALRASLAGCYLVRHGRAGGAALAELQTRRAAGTNGWKHEPAARKVRRFIRSWPIGG